jgi:UDP-N-acetylglucosamine/UDP-N-acetylgalactosamine 4-epimerase
MSIPPTTMKPHDMNERWLITGAAGFIGSHLLEAALRQGRRVVGMDNFLTGFRSNLGQVREQVGSEAWSRFTFIEADATDPEACRRCCDGVAVVFHQAALGSVPRSIAQPLDTNGNNVDATLNLLVAAKGSGVRRFIYASSSSVYGDHPALPKVEEVTGNLLSPYAASKRVGELYAGVFARTYGLETIGLRYFNVFGARQNPAGQYAAVIPRWIRAMLRNEPVVIYGDGRSSRDFCHVENVVQANFLAAATDRPEAINQIYNIAAGGQTNLNELFRLIRDRLQKIRPGLRVPDPECRDFRPGDIRHSHADIGKAREKLGYVPTHDVIRGLDESIGWYVAGASGAHVPEVCPAPGDDGGKIKLVNQ